MSHSEMTALRVFVIGDEDRAVSMVLRKWGSEVETIDGRAYPIREARRFRPDLMLIDVGQALFDGFAHVRRVRRRAEFGAIPLAVFADFLRNGGRVQVIPTGHDAQAVTRLPSVELARVLDEIRQLIVIPQADLLQQKVPSPPQIETSREARIVARRARWAGSSKEAGSGSKKPPGLQPQAFRVLLFERQGESLHSLFPLLKRLGFDVAACFSPDDCVNCTRRNAPAVVLLNSGRPAYLAYDTARRIQQVAGPEKPLIVRVSSADDRMQDFLAAEVGITQQLTKPLQVQELVAVLSSLEDLRPEREQGTKRQVGQSV